VLDGNKPVELHECHTFPHIPNLIRHYRNCTLLVSASASALLRHDSEPSSDSLAWLKVAESGFGQGPGHAGPCCVA
jgi:hypothetical protein